MESEANDSPEVASPPLVRFGYFVLQARAQGEGDQVRVAGVIENLSTGEKQSFGSTDEMVRWFGKWAGLALSCVIGLSSCGGGDSAGPNPPPPPPPAPAPVATVSISPDSTDVIVGFTVQLTATAKDAQGNTLSGRSVSWVGSDPIVASVSTAGLVTALAPGRATLTATIGGKAGTAIVVVTTLRDTLPGASTSQAVGSFPLRVAQFNPANFSTDHPSFPGFPVSFNTIAVTIAPDATIGQVNDLLKAFDAQIVGGVPGVTGRAAGLLVLRLPTRSHVELADRVTLLRQNPIVRGIAVDKAIGTEEIPKPILHQLSPSIDWTIGPAGGNWGLEAVNAPALWNLNAYVRKRPLRPLTGVLDDGFARHADLSYSEVVDAGDSTLSHGVHIAGIIGATYDNAVGVDGINPFARLVVKASGNSVYKLVTDFAAFLFQRPNLSVINLSMGYSWSKRNPPLNPITDSTRRASVDQDGAALVAVLTTFADSGFVLPVIVASGGNDAVVFPNHPSGYNSPFTNAALVQGAAPIIVVQALENDFGTGRQRRAPYSNHGGHVSAPGSAVLSTFPGNNYALEDGASMAAPHVTGLVGYLYALAPSIPAPTLTSNPIRDLLIATATPVTGASPRIDAFAAALQVDRLVGGDQILRALLDIDDGTPDGNQRVGPHEADDDVDGDGGPGDGKVDMADFRRWRDWLLQLEQAQGTSLNGPPDHFKRDINGDSVVESPAFEAVFARGDFNGDGKLDRGSDAPVAGVLNGQRLTDLDVLRSRFDDPHYHETALPLLLRSGDITVDATACLTLPQVASVRTDIRLADKPDSTVRARIFTAADGPQVFTEEVYPPGYHVQIHALDAAGNALGPPVATDSTVGLGGDVLYKPPACKAVQITVAFPNGVSEQAATPVEVTAGELDLGTGAVTFPAGIQIGIVAAGGTVTPGSGQTDNAGRFTANVRLAPGSSLLTLTVTARIPGGPVGRVVVSAGGVQVNFFAGYNLDSDPACTDQRNQQTGTSANVVLQRSCTMNGVTFAMNATNTSTLARGQLVGATSHAGTPTVAEGRIGSGSASFRITDRVVIDAPGLTGTQGSFVARLELTGSITHSGPCGSDDAVAEWTASGVVMTLQQTSIQPIFSTSGRRDSCAGATGQPLPIVLASPSVTFTYGTPFLLRYEVFASGFTTSGGSSQPYSAQSSIAFRWLGMQGLPSGASLSSASGVNWSQAAP